jgi:four helix bundle protein
MQNFRNLAVWRKSHQLVLEAYAFSATLSHPRHFFLRDQLLRAAISVPSNLAEGCGRTGDRELRRFVRIALGSASELEYHFLLARDLGVLPEPTYEKLTAAAIEIKRMLSGLSARLSAKPRAES